MLSSGENLDLLRRCREALAPGGRIVIQDFILEEDKTAPRFAALFAINMLVGTSGGSSYSEPEYAAWLGEAGFRDIRPAPLPGKKDTMQSTWWWAQAAAAATASRSMPHGSARRVSAISATHACRESPGS